MRTDVRKSKKKRASESESGLTELFDKAALLQVQSFKQEKSKSRRASSEYDLNLKAIENEVNVHGKSLMSPAHENLLLSYQVKKLQICFEVYLTIRERASHPNVWERNYRGRGRLMPFDFNEEFIAMDQRS